MGMRLMLGGIVEAIGSLFGNLFSWLIGTLVVPVVTGAIKSVVEVIKYVFGYLFYLIGTFLLQILDLIEALFKSLAGLENVEGGTFFFSVGDNKGGDLLVQMLTSDIVINAFLSCCIVGIFLLLITTIFQMIKVEYTSEGAQNSKTSIIGKSLKHFANLLLIPVLVIFGVIIGNTVLDLINTATGNNKNKISGLLFVTAASDAMWAPNVADGVEAVFGKVKDIAQVLGFTVTLSIDKSMNAVLKEIFKLDVPTTEIPDTVGDYINDNDLTTQEVKELRANYIKAVEDGFIAQDDQHRYTNVVHVFKYYNLYEINYLVLIFGVCVIIKALGLSCFGLIDRIYQCLALFIISPFVIGMAPVKDSLASWRTKFIQKALSAYGVVISVNLFFIISTLFVNMNITFNPGNSIFRFSSSFVEGLIKSVFIIVGCLMVEKLAGDLGQYFGGGNALAEGKGLASEATKGLTTAVKFGAGVAMGGAGLAMKLGKGVAGGIGKLGGKIKSAQTNHTLKKGIKDDVKAIDAGPGDKLDDYLEHEKQSEQADTAYKAAEAQVDMHQRAINSNNIAINKNNEIINDKKGIYTEAEKNAARAENKKLVMSNNEEEAKLTGAKNRLRHAADDKYKLDNELHNDAGLQQAKRYNDAQTHLTESRDKQKEIAEAKEKAKEEKAEKKEKRAQHTRDVLLTGANAIGALGKDGLKSIIPGFAQQWGKDWKEAKEKGNSVSPEGQAAMDRLKKEKSDAAENAYNENLFNKRLISQTQQTQNQLLTKAVIEKAEFHNADLNKQMEPLIKQWEGLANKTGKSESDHRTMEYLENAMRSINPKVEFEENSVVNAKIDLNIDALKESINSALKKNATTDQINQIIADHLKKFGLDKNDQILKELKKAVEEVKNSVGGK